MSTPHTNNWTFIDSPWDLLLNCTEKNIADYYCILNDVLGILCAYCFPVISIFGLLTNALIVFIFFGRQRKQLTRQMVYIGCLAVADSLNIISFGWMWMFLAKGLPYASKGTSYYFTFSISLTVCRFHRYFYSFTSTFVCNILLLIVGDRFFSIFLPIQFSRFSAKLAGIWVGVTVAVSAVLMIPIGVRVDLHATASGKITCWLYEWDAFLQFYHVLLSNCGFIQTILIIILNGAIIGKLIHRDRLAQNGQATGGNSKREIYAFKTALMLSLIFIIAALPMSISYALAFYFQNNTNYTGYVRLMYNIADISWQLFLAQESTNFILYMHRMASFRRQLKILLGIKITANDQSTVDTRSKVVPTNQ